jgi:hypothetical protein
MGLASVTAYRAPCASARAIAPCLSAALGRDYTQAIFVTIKISRIAIAFAYNDGM